jgi:phosphate transport system permease protein
MSKSITQQIQSGLARRHARTKRLRCYGVLALIFACAMLLWLVASLVEPALRGLMRHEVQLVVDTAPFAKGLRTHPEQVALLPAVQQALRSEIPEANDISGKRALYRLLGDFAAFDARRSILAQPEAWGKKITLWVPLSDLAAQYRNGRITREQDAKLRPLSDAQLNWLDRLEAEHKLRTGFHSEWLTRGDSRAPESAGFMGSIVGSLFLIFVAIAASLPVGVLGAVYLEEFAAKSRINSLIEIAISNLAAVPSILFGLLGLAVYLVWFGLPRSSALVGGLTVALMVLPIIIISTRASLKAVPPSLRQAAAALGATRVQIVAHHVVPYALPGIMTGSILGIARALGETAPLLLIGMVAFVADIPESLLDPATAMPVTIYLWASSPEAGFLDKTASGILTLLAILLALNAAAIYIRQKYEIKW